MMTKPPRQRKQPEPNFWDRFWRDSHGRDVIWQKPNVFLVTWIVATVITWFIPFSMFEEIIGGIGFVALIIWAFLELFSGVNNFRRTLGLMVLIVAIVNRLR